MEVIGKVIDIQDSKITVIIENNNSCNGCSACSKNKNCAIELDNLKNINIKINDNVIINMKDKKFVFIGFILYGLPVIIFISSYFAFSRMFFKFNEQISVLVSLLLLIGYFFILKFSMRGFKEYEIIELSKKD
jgi:sigma-E factor negative regulatory protein RseC